MKLGICCVYFYGEDGSWLLPLQLRFIAETLCGYAYTIYAAANRLSPELREILRSTPNVKIVELPHIAERANSEHAIYLDKLLKIAHDDGCSHLVALDSDSFPIATEWPSLLLAKMGDRMRFSAALRAENGDTVLPHPCAYFMTRQFYADHRPSLLPAPSVTQSPRFQEFLQRNKQRSDTGIGYGYTLWDSQEQWLPLLRSNRHNPHFLMAGIYGDVFFHLGSSSRRPAFHMDYQTRLSLRLAGRLRSAPLVWRISELITEIYLKKNQKLFQKITIELKDNPYGFLAKLTNISH